MVADHVRRDTFPSANNNVQGVDVGLGGRAARPGHMARIKRSRDTDPLCCCGVATDGCNEMGKQALDGQTCSQGKGRAGYFGYGTCKQTRCRSGLGTVFAAHAAVRPAARRVGELLDRRREHSQLHHGACWPRQVRSRAVSFRALQRASCEV
jgi:hypothetical protein